MLEEAGMRIDRAPLPRGARPPGPGASSGADATRSSAVTPVGPCGAGIFRHVWIPPRPVSPPGRRSEGARQMTPRLEYRDGVRRAYPDVYSPEAVRALEALAPFNRDRRE